MTFDVEGYREVYWLEPPNGPPESERLHQCEGCGRRVRRLHHIVEEGTPLAVCDGCLPAPLPGQLPKRCSCGVVYQTHRAWCELKLVGHQPDEDLTLELRNCRCGSTIAIEVDVTVSAMWTTQ